MGSAEKKQKIVLERGVLHSKPPVHVPVDVQWPSEAGMWLCPTGGTHWEQHREPVSLSQDREKPNPSWGPNRHKKLRLKHTSEKNMSEVEGHLDSAWLA